MTTVITILMNLAIATCNSQNNTGYFVYSRVKLCLSDEFCCLTAMAEVFVCFCL